MGIQAFKNNNTGKTLINKKEIDDGSLNYLKTNKK